MKTILTVLAILLLVSCDSNDSNVKYSYSFNSDGEIKREMTVKNKLNDIEIEMEGNASFDKNDSTITAITPGGIINYRNKKAELKAITSKNGLTVTIEENGIKVSNTSDRGKEIQTEAIRYIKNLQKKYK